MSQYDGYAPQGIAAGGLSSLTPWTENIDGAGFTLSDAVLASDVDADAIANLVRTDKTNVFGDFNQDFKDNRIRIFNPADTFAFTIIAPAIGAARDITLPLLLGNDVIVTEAFIQDLSNKTLLSRSNVDAITNVVRTDKANIFGAFKQTFKNDTFRITNPAVSFDYTFLASAIVADREITLPLLGGNDIFVFEAFAQILTNKTIDGDDNTLQDIDFSSLADGVDGELITWDASGVIDTVAVGTVGQVLTSGGVGVAPTFQASTGGEVFTWSADL